MDKRLLIGGFFFFILILSIVLTSGVVVNCANSASYTDCATYGCFKVVNASGTPMAIIDGDGFMDIDRILYESYAMSSWTPSTNTFSLFNSSGRTAAIVANGNLVIGGTVTDDQQTYCTPPAGSFIIKNSAGNCVAYISKSGDVWLRGRLCYNASSTG